MTRLVANLRFTGALLAINLKASVALRGKFWLQVSFMFVNNATFFVFWWVLFHRVGSLRGWVVNDVLLLYGLSAGAMGLMQTCAGGVRHIGRLVDEGELDPLLVQPKSTWLYVVGSRSQPSGIGDMLSGIWFVVMSGHVTLHNMAFAILCTLCGACVFLGIASILYSLSFWLRRTESVSRQALDLLMLFSIYPESLFGGIMRWLLFSIVPAGFVSYIPVHVLRDGKLSELPLVIVAAAAFLWLGSWVFERGLRRYASGSRFSVWGA